MAVGAGSASWQHNAPLSTGAGTQPWQEPTTGWNEDTAWHPAAPWQQAQAVCLSAPVTPRPTQAAARLQRGLQETQDLGQWDSQVLL